MNDKSLILDRLQSQGYNPPAANIVANELVNVSPILQSCVNKWLNGEEVDHECHGYCINSLMKLRHMTYPAALLTIDWLIKEPEQAIKSIAKGIR